MISNAIIFLLKFRYQRIYLFVKYFNSLSLNINNVILNKKDIKNIKMMAVKINNNILMFWI